MGQRVFAWCALALAALVILVDPFLACIAAYAGLAGVLAGSGVKGRRRVFLHWALALASVWVLLNLPKDGGSLKRLLWQWAGFPWVFAYWEYGQLSWFDPAAFAGDVALGAAVAVGVAGLCAWSRRQPAVAPVQGHPSAHSGRPGR